MLREISRFFSDIGSPAPVATATAAAIPARERLLLYNMLKHAEHVMDSAAGAEREREEEEREALEIGMWKVRARKTR